MALKELSLVEIQVMFGSNCGSELEDPANYHRQTYKIMTTCSVPVPSKNGAHGDGCPEDERHPNPLTGVDPDLSMRQQRE